MSKIQEIYVWTTKVRPTKTIKTYDFTQSDCWVTYYGSLNSYANYGRNSYGFYATGTNTSSYYLNVVAWKIPSSITSQWLPKKITLYYTSSSARYWLGLCYWVDTRVYRWWDGGFNINWWWQNENPSTPSIAWDREFIIDIENKKLTTSLGYSTSLTSSSISAFTTDWNANNVNFCIMINSQSWTSTWYMKRMVLEY